MEQKRTISVSANELKLTNTISVDGQHYQLCAEAIYFTRQQVTRLRSFSTGLARLWPGGVT